MVEKKKIRFDFDHGTVNGIVARSPAPSPPLVILTNGHNGFYGYGMFPYIQDRLALAGISSFSYNFSHGGIEEDDYFTRLDLYEKNCMRLETEDLVQVIKGLEDSEIDYSKDRPLILMAHSLGGVPTVFAIKRLLGEGCPINGAILVSTVMTLGFRSKDQMDEWGKNNVLLQRNKRTGQMLPQGKEFLEETKNADGDWSMQQALKYAKTNYLIIHGEKDEAVPVRHAISLNSWNEEYKNPTKLVIIPDATHTYNTRHPFTGPSIELNALTSVMSEWIIQL